MVRSKPLAEQTAGSRNAPLPPPSPIATVKRTNWGAIASFIDGSSIFALSRMWSDLIAIFAFGLHPVPFCGGFLHEECSAEAPASQQFLYAFGCVPVAAVLKHLSETSFRNVPGASHVPTMMSYFVGWALGQAFQQTLVEITDANPMLCSEELGCTLMNVFFSFGLTTVTAIIIIWLHPYSQNIDFGDGECINWFEDLLEDLWQLIIRGCATTSMVIWYYTASQYISVGTQGATDFAQFNLLLHFSLVTFFIGSILSLKLEKGEGALRDVQKVQPAAWRAAIIRYSDVLQNLLGYVTGCLINEVMLRLLPTLSQGPTVTVLLINLGICAVVTAVTIFILAQTGEVTMDGTTEREQVETYFIVNSLGFCVGWLWLVLVRDIVTMTGLALRIVLAPFGVTSAQDHITQLAGVLLAGPFVTLGLGWVQGRMSHVAGGTGPTARVEKEKHDLLQERRQRKADAAVIKASVPSTGGSNRYCNSWRRPNLSSNSSASRRALN